MSDVVAVALITGGLSVTAAAVGAVVTYQVNKQNTDVELEKVKAENERLRAQHREDERRHRQGSYHSFIDVSTAIFQHMGLEWEGEDLDATTKQYNYLYAGLLLFGTEPVKEVVQDLNAIYNGIWTDVDAQPSSKPYAQRWRDATAPLKQQFADLWNRAVDVMHQDVTSGVLRD